MFNINYFENFSLILKFLPYLFNQDKKSRITIIRDEWKEEKKSSTWEIKLIRRLWWISTLF